MNIFVLSKNPGLAARYHNNKHVIKMILESKQVLDAAGSETAKNKHGKQLAWYHHPCTRWARESRTNFLWLIRLGIALCTEYTYRYGKVHAYSGFFRELLFNIPEHLPHKGLTPFALAMPDDCKTDSAVKSYRLYYNRYKQHLASWKRRTIPSWYKGEIL
jgi:hypothetical protein